MQKELKGGDMKLKMAKKSIFFHLKKVNYFVHVLSYIKQFLGYA